MYIYYVIMYIQLKSSMAIPRITNVEASNPSRRHLMAASAPGILDEYHAVLHVGTPSGFEWSVQGPFLASASVWLLLLLGGSSHESKVGPTTLVISMG